MDVRSEQKPRKRRTRSDLNNIRKRSRKEEKNNVTATTMNTTAFKNIPKYYNELTTGENLSLAMFKKVIRSNTVTRLPLSRCHNTDNLKEIITKYSHQPPRCFSSINKSSIIFQNNNNNISLRSITFQNNNNALRRPKVELFGKNADQIIDNEYDRYSVASHLLLNELEDVENLPLEILNYRCENLSTSSLESHHCSYEKFMKELPAYLKEHFPTLTSSNYQDKENNIAMYIKTPVNLPERDSQLVIQDPLVYIQRWEHSVQKKQSILLSNNCSSSLSEFESNVLNIFINSPDYHYFPHKLN